MDTPLWTLDELGARVALALAVDYDGQANGRGVEDLRWSKVYDKPLGDSESDSDVKLSDFEMDLSESGR